MLLNLRMPEQAPAFYVFARGTQFKSSMGSLLLPLVLGIDALHDIDQPVRSAFEKRHLQFREVVEDPTEKRAHGMNHKTKAVIQRVDLGHVAEVAVETETGIATRVHRERHAKVLRFFIQRIKDLV